MSNTRKFQDDKFQHLESDISKMRSKSRMYISYSNEQAARAVVLEIIANALDEVRNPRSPANTITIEFDERSGFIRVVDNGRGIPISKLELTLTTLNSGSNIDSGEKVQLKTNILGRNGVGTLAMTALAEKIVVTSYRGGTEDVFKRLTFVEGTKVNEEDGSCPSSKHGLEVLFKPSKILGKNTKIIWSDIRTALVNLQFLEKKKFNLSSIYTDQNGNEYSEKYKARPFADIVPFKNGKGTLVTNPISVGFNIANISEEVGDEIHKRFVNFEVAFAYVNTIAPNIDSYCNGNSTIDNGHHLDSAMESICRYFQTMTKNSLSDREKDKLDIKWDDVKQGLSISVLLDTNMENIFTSQTKHKIQSDDLKVLIREHLSDALSTFGISNADILKELIAIIKLNARARVESEKIKTTVVRERLTDWASFRMKNYDPCSNTGKQYKELFIVEGISAKGSLNLARDPTCQALFAIRGVSANVFKLDLNGILKNEEFKTLIQIMGCNVGTSFNIDKLIFDKIIIAADADIDGQFIKALLLSFYFKVFPEIIQAGKLFIAEPPLYRVKHKKNPFVVNREDYLNRYIADILKQYQLKLSESSQYMTRAELKNFLTSTSKYAEEIRILGNHYKISERLIELILNQFAKVSMQKNIVDANALISAIDIQSLTNEIGTEFVEIYYDDNDKLIKGIIDGKYQSIELSERLVRKGFPLIQIMVDYKCQTNDIILKNIRTGIEEKYNLLALMKLFKKYQPDIEFRFKGLAENNPEDLKVTTMNPNTRTLIRVSISSIENDARIFNVLRGSSPNDAQARKLMVREYIPNPELIDT